MTYLDYQATTPLAPEVLAGMLPWLEHQHANPHSAHREGRAAKAAVELARAQVVSLLPEGGRIAFTSGATEALNWAIKGTSGGIVTLASEHAAVLDTVTALRDQGRATTILPVGRDGLVDMDAARAAIMPGTGLVAAMQVNNEIGVIQPIAALAELAHSAGALMLCDAVQGYGRVEIPASCDFVAISGHKIYGPKGTGALWVRDGIELAPLLHGGGQEALGRSGTLSPALCAGFGIAAALMAARAHNDSRHVEHLWNRAALRLGLLQSVSPGEARAARDPTRRPAWVLNGAATPRYKGNLNVRRDGLDVARLMSDLRDIAFSAGSACASGSGRPSHVLSAIGLGDKAARASIRIGFGRYTTEDELTVALDRVIAAADAQRIAA